MTRICSPGTSGAGREAAGPSEKRTARTRARCFPWLAFTPFASHSSAATPRRRTSFIQERHWIGGQIQDDVAPRSSDAAPDVGPGGLTLILESAKSADDLFV